MFGLFKYKLNAGLISDIGRKRFENQDNFSFDTYINADKKEHIELEVKNKKLPQVYAIMDGMGGEKLGAQASLEAAGFFSYIYEKVLLGLDKADDKRRQRIFESLVYTLNERVRNMASEHGVKQTGTTLAAVFFTDKKAYVLSVGDSEVFLIEGKDIKRLNKLDSLTVMINDESGKQKEVKGGISQFLGMDTSEYDFHLNIKELDIEDKYSFIICSDGLTDYVKEEEIADIVRKNKLMDSIKMLLALALERGGRDNVTIIRVDVTEAIF